MGHHVQHGLAFETGHVVGDEIAFFLAAPDFDLQIGCHVDPAVDGGRSVGRESIVGQLFSK
jgi:hypothetical protein